MREGSLRFEIAVDINLFCTSRVVVDRRQKANAAYLVPDLATLVCVRVVGMNLAANLDSPTKQLTSCLFVTPPPVDVTVAQIFFETEPATQTDRLCLLQGSSRGRSSLYR